MLIFLTESYSFLLKFDLPMCINKHVVIFTPTNVTFENDSLFLKVSNEGKFLLLQYGEINGKLAMLSYRYA